MEPMATILKTARIRLREVTESDLDTLATMEVGPEAALPTETQPMQEDRLRSVLESSMTVGSPRLRPRLM
jgi:RimJ/RimL family protein N-acetyltransferase